MIISIATFKSFTKHLRHLCSTIIIDNMTLIRFASLLLKTSSPANALRELKLLVTLLNMTSVTSTRGDLLLKVLEAAQRNGVESAILDSVLNISALLKKMGLDSTPSTTLSIMKAAIQCFDKPGADADALLKLRSEAIKLFDTDESLDVSSIAKDGMISEIHRRHTLISDLYCF